MTTKEEKSEEILLDVRPNLITQVTFGYNDEEVLMILEYENKIDDKAIKEKFAATFPPGALQGMIEGLFDCGKAYQQEHGKDIGFGNVKGE